MSVYHSLVRSTPCVSCATAQAGATAADAPTCTPSAGMFIATLIGGIAVGFVIERVNRPNCGDAHRVASPAE